MFGRGLGIAAALLAVCAGAAQAATIEDPAGDANALGTAGLSVATAPASDATRDITRVTADRTADGLVVRFTLSAPPQLEGPLSFAILRATRGLCGVSLVAVWGNNAQDGPSGPIAVSDLDDCDEEFFGVGAPGYTAAIEGSTVVTRFPYTALAQNQMGIGPSTALTNLRGETIVGTFGAVGSWSFCSPEPCQPSGWRHAKSGFIGPVVDATAGGGTLRPMASVRRPGKRRR